MKKAMRISHGFFNSKCFAYIKDMGMMTQK